MTHYLIEFRFQGKAKSKIKELILEIDRRCHIGNTKIKRPVPHITLVAPFNTNNERKLIQDFYNLCSKTELMKFNVKGFNTFEDNQVVYLDIKPSTKLDEFRWELSKKLQPYCNLKPIDYKRQYAFHSTIAMKLTPSKFKQVKEYIKRKHEPSFDHIVVRATLLKNSYILKEYDFLQRKMFDRKLAKSKHVHSRTIYLLKKFFEGNYDPNKHMKLGLWNKIQNIFGQ